MSSYKPDSPFVRAAMDMLDRGGVKFENFGTLDDKAAWVRFKPQWPYDARAWFESGQVVEATIKVKRARGAIVGRVFRIEFKPQPTSFRGRPAMATPSLELHLDSLDELRAMAAVHRERRAFEKITRGAPKAKVSKPSKTGGRAASHRKKTGGPI